MARDDWYRNERWDAEIEAAFRARLARSRRPNRDQYLTLQAGHLAKAAPEAAIALAEEYLASGDTLYLINALGARAAAFEALGRFDQAIADYKRALDHEREHPHLIGTARWDYPCLVATQRIAGDYADALTVLAERFQPGDMGFPRHRYLWNGAQALILSETGRRDEARRFAERALAAAAETQSPYRHHRTMGLVNDSDDDFRRRLKRIAEPSALRRLLRLA